MYQKLFQVTLVVLLVVVSVAVLGVVGSVVISMFLSSSGTNGISAGGGGFSFHIIAISARQLGLMIVAGSLIIAGLYLYARRNRFRR